MDGTSNNNDHTVEVVGSGATGTGTTSHGDLEPASSSRLSAGKAAGVGLGGLLVALAAFVAVKHYRKTHVAQRVEPVAAVGTLTTVVAREGRSSRPKRTAAPGAFVDGGVVVAPAGESLPNASSGSTAGSWPSV